MLEYSMYYYTAQARILVLNHGLTATITESLFAVGHLGSDATIYHMLAVFLVRVASRPSTSVHTCKVSVVARTDNN